MSFNSISSNFLFHYSYLHRPSQGKCQDSATDIARILDPSYRHSDPYTSKSVYIDGGGELHDPDYRPFDIPTDPTSYSHHPHLDRHSSAQCARPVWQQDDEEVLSDDDGVSMEGDEMRTEATIRRYAYYSNRSSLVQPFSYLSRRHSNQIRTHLYQPSLSDRISISSSVNFSPNPSEYAVDTISYGRGVHTGKHTLRCRLRTAVVKMKGSVRRQLMKL